jgi:hypothetical protein
VVADEDDAERDDGEVEAAQPHGHRPDEEAGDGGDDARSGQPDPHRQAVAEHWAVGVPAQHRPRVGADAYEECVAERDLARVPGDQVEPDCADRGDHAEREDLQQVVGDQEGHQERQHQDDGERATLARRVHQGDVLGVGGAGERAAAQAAAARGQDRRHTRSTSLVP